MKTMMQTKDMLSQLIFLFMPVLGITMPDMGTKQNLQMQEASPTYAVTSVADALFTNTQQRVLACLFGQSTKNYNVTELIERTRAGSGAVQREVAKLVGCGLLTTQIIGNQKRYQVNLQSPIAEELIAIVRKTIGLADPLRDALTPIATQIKAAFIYGSIAKGTDHASSDLDLFVVSDSLTYADMMLEMNPVENFLKRKINPTIYTLAELKKRKKDKNAFVTKVMTQEKIWLIGDEHALSAR